VRTHPERDVDVEEVRLDDSIPLGSIELRATVRARVEGEHFYLEMGDRAISLLPGREFVMVAGNGIGAVHVERGVHQYSAGARRREPVGVSMRRVADRDGHPG